jgi:deoxyribonuclease I
MRKIFVILMFVFIGSTLFAPEMGNTRINSFGKVKKILRKLYQNHRITFYCGCTYDREVNHSSCGYKPKRPLTKKGKKNKRAFRIEWEHVVPAHAFGKSFKEWQIGDPKCGGKKGRKCARKNKLFARMEADLYNLVPAIGEVNSNRSNYSMADIPGEEREYGSCDVEIKGRKVEPRPAVRGNIARTYLYMDWAYPGRGIISAHERKFFETWDKADPVDDWECERARLIEKVQGNANLFVKRSCRDFN